MTENSNIIFARYQGEESKQFKKGAVYKLWLHTVDMNFWDKMLTLLGAENKPAYTIRKVSNTSHQKTYDNADTFTADWKLGGLK